MSKEDEKQESKDPRHGLSRMPDDNSRSRLQANLDRVLTDKLLAQTDVGAALARDLSDNASLSLPSLTDIAAKFQQEATTLHVPDARNLLELDKLGDLTVQGVRLNELMSRGSDSLEERSILKRGLAFLRKSMYKEAAEWWVLNRPKDHLSNTRLYCLLTLLLAFTYDLAGRRELAQAAKAEALQARSLLKS